MKQILLLLSLALFSVSASADKGEVVKEDVCGIGNVIIETTDGWYVAAEHILECIYMKVIQFMAI